MRQPSLRNPTLVKISIEQRPAAVTNLRLRLFRCSYPGFTALCHVNRRIPAVADLSGSLVADH